MGTSGKCLSSWKTISRKPRLASAARKSKRPQPKRRRPRRHRLQRTQMLRAAPPHLSESRVNHPLRKRVVAEALGTSMLLAAVVGSGIMGERLAAGNTAIALLANTIATGAALAALILAFGPISGAHFNPAVTLADAWQRGIRWREVPAYILAQVVGAFAGVASANVMFGEPVFFASHHARHGGAQLFSEFVATFGLLAVIWGCVRARVAVVPFAVAAY